MAQTMTDRKILRKKWEIKLENTDHNTSRQGGNRRRFTRGKNHVPASISVRS